ncbi:hypothetical protein BH20ACT16_BH20ACT16_02720 [soil metagenome]
MSNGARIGLLVGTLVALVLAFVLLSPEVDDESSTATAPATPPVTTPAAPDGEATQTTTAATLPPAPTFTTVRVRGGKPVGGLKTITVESGDQVRIRVSSTDTSDEIHLHGYDKYANVAPNKPARFAFKANAEGIFEIELHGTGTQIAKLVVEP